MTSIISFIIYIKVQTNLNKITIMPIHAKTKYTGIFIEKIVSHSKSWIIIIVDCV